MRLFKFLPKRIGKLGVVIFTSSLAFAIVCSVMSIYVNSFVHNEALVGFVFTFLVIISMITHFCIIPVIESKSKSKIFMYTLFLIGIGYILYSIIENFYLFLLIAVAITIFTSLRVASSGLLIEHSSNKKSLAKNEGLIYTFMNLAWVVGPLIVGFILEKVDVIKNIFILAAVIVILAGVLFKIFKINYSGKKKKIDTNIFRNFKDFFKDKDRVKAYILSAGITFWWALIFVYMPLLIIQRLNDAWVGFFLFFSMIPLILLQYYFGYYAGKRGYKKIFVMGYLIPAIFAVLCFFYFESIWFIIIAMSLASIGLSMTEGTSEAYFFDVLKDGQDQRFYSPYNTAIDVGSLGGEFIPALILLLLPFKFIFLFFALGMFLLAILSLKIKEVIESRRKADGFK